jgi:hypothetical protein
MTHKELDAIEENLRKVEKVTPGSYGIVTALQLAAELRKLLPATSVSEAQGDEGQSQLVASAPPA